MLVSARSEREAVRKAAKLAKGNQHSYRNPNNELVAWKFVEVLEVEEILEGQLGDGVEVYSRCFTKLKW